MGFAGVQNFPTVALVDGLFRQGLEETGMGYDVEVEMVRAAGGVDVLGIAREPSRYASWADVTATRPDVMVLMLDELISRRIKLAEINDYCRCDVLDTYFAFLRTMVILGNLKLEDEQRLVDEVHEYLSQRATTIPAYANYLQQWGNWVSPWETP